jgi:hypothetical protein
MPMLHHDTWRSLCSRIWKDDASHPLKREFASIGCYPASARIEMDSFESAGVDLHRLNGQRKQLRPQLVIGKAAGA